MRRLALTLAFCLATAVPLAGAQDEPVYRAPAAPPRSAPLVYRGSAAPPGANAPVRVHRGSAIGPMPSATTRVAAPVVTGGNRLWVVDPEGGRVVACRLARTLQVGRRQVRCYDGELSLD